MTNIKITMLGARGVGKTSLMAALYHCSNNILSATKLKISLGLDTKKRLDSRLQNLRNLSNSNCFKADGGGDSTANASLYTFNLSSRNSDKPSLEFTFQDYPGEDHNKKTENVKNYLTECTAVLIAIDSSAMIEEKGRWHESINRPQQILELFKGTYQDLKFPKLVIFAPVKCETYMVDKKSIDNLYSTTEASYKELIEFFRSPSLSDKVDFTIAPVQTVGSVIFSYIKEIEGEPQFFYRKRNSSDNCQPHGGEEVLRHLLKFILRTHVAQNSRIFRFLQNMFNKDCEFKEAIEKLALASKTDRYSGMFEKQLTKR